MGIVSVSLDDESMESLDAIVSAFGLKGRSEAVRLAIRMAVAELKDDDDFNGPVEGVMIISGDGKSIKDMMHEIQSTGEAKYLKFVRS